MDEVPAQRRHLPEAALSRISVVHIDHEHDEADAVITVGSILHCFLGEAVAARLVEVHDPHLVVGQPGWVYVRTAQQTYRTHFRSIEALHRRLPKTFAKANRSVLVNLDKIDHPELGRQRLHRVGMRVAGRPGERLMDWVIVSRRQLGVMRYHLGFPARASGSASSTQ